MKRKRRVIRTDFPTGDLDMEEIKRGFRELRRKRLGRELGGGLTNAAPAAPGPKRRRHTAGVESAAELDHP